MAFQYSRVVPSIIRRPNLLKVIPDWLRYDIPDGMRIVTLIQRWERWDRTGPINKMTRRFGEVVELHDGHLPEFWYPFLDPTDYDIVPLFMATTIIYLTSGTTWAVPGDWNSTNNTIEGWGAGQAGTSANTGSSSVGGGKSGAYASISNQILTSGASIPTTIGAGGTTSGQNGGDTSFNTTSLVAPGGNTGSSITGTVTNVGATGGVQSPSNGSGGGGGAGAGGPNGVGKAGGLSPGPSTLRGGGGGGGSDGGSSSAGGASQSSPGNTGGVGGNNNAGSGGGLAGQNTVSPGDAGGNGSAGAGGGGGGGGGTGHGDGGLGGDDADKGGGGGGGAGWNVNTNVSGNGANGGFPGGGGGGYDNGGTHSVGTGGAGQLKISYVPSGVRVRMIQFGHRGFNTYGPQIG